jgi:hypothetical protein
VQHRNAVCEVKACYLLLDKDIRSAGLLKPVLFSEELHLTQPFANAVQRFRFIENMHLSVDVDLLKYSPGGSNCVLVFAYQVDEHHRDNDALTQSAQIVAQLKPQLPEFHTRQMKKTFKQKCEGLAKITPSFLEGIYHELAMHASTAGRPEVQERIRLILLGETGLIPDMRSINPGRPSGKSTNSLLKCPQS